MTFLVNAPRWLFLAALVYAPWAYGCTRPWSVAILDAALLAVVALWLLGCALRRMRPYLPWPLAVAGLFILAQGWLMIANAEAFYDRELFQFVPVRQPLPFAPGVVDRLDSVPAMLRVTALLGALWFATDLAWRPVWRRRLWWTAALAGVSLVLCGLGMKILDIHISSYVDPTDVGVNSFAFYFYHANAGAFINLVLPLVAGLAALGFLRPKSELRRALWVPGTLICIAGSVATASKGAMSITAPLLLILTLWFVRLARERDLFRLSAGRLALAVAAGAAVIGAMCLLSWGHAAERWGELGASHGGIIRPRLLVSQVCFKMMADSNFFGFGPGNFAIAFPHYTNYLGNSLAGVWQFAHEDYLQTIVEWGFIGALPWAVLFFGGLWQGWRTLRAAPLELEDEVLLTTALLALAGVAVHAFFDFPLQIASIQLYVATLLGLCWGSPLFVDPKTGRRK